jgi:hypothetical protein
VVNASLPPRCFYHASDSRYVSTAGLIGLTSARSAGILRCFPYAHLRTRHVSKPACPVLPNPCSAGILKQLSRKFVANLARIKDETVFNDAQRYPDAPYAMASVGSGACRPHPWTLHPFLSPWVGGAREAGMASHACHARWDTFSGAVRGRGRSRCLPHAREVMLEGYAFVSKRPEREEPVWFHEAGASSGEGARSQPSSKPDHANAAAVCVTPCLPDQDLHRFFTAWILQEGLGHDPKP